MIPIADTNPTRRVPVVNWALIGINIVVFLYELTLRPRQLDLLVSTWGVTPVNILGAIQDPETTPLMIWATLITSQFLHAGWAHIIGNMLFLWVFGDNIEDVLGHFSYLVFYLAAVIAAGLIQSLVSGPTRIPAVGASGAIAGVLGAYMILYPWARISILVPLFIIFTTLEIPALIVIGWWFIQQFFYGIGVLGSMSSNIAFWAHIGGFLAGMLFILPYIGRARRRRAARAYSLPRIES